MADFRFSFNILAVDSREKFVETCRQGERYGYDTVFAADHLGYEAPFPVLVAAAAVTERLKVGTLVLNVPFWNPALLAREAATADVLTDGRLELGLGAGHMKWEFEEAGIPWEPFAKRADRLEATIRELGRLFAADGHPQQAAQREAMAGPAARLRRRRPAADRRRHRRPDPADRRRVRRHRRDRGRVSDQGTAAGDLPHRHGRGGRRAGAVRARHRR
jgi:probable F420-dependent oxidoreductase